MLSASATRRASRHRRSTSNSPTRVLTSGRGRPAFATTRSSATSSSLRVAVGSQAAKMSRTASAPARYRTQDSTDRESRRRSASARSRVRSRSRRPRTAARSASVRETVVTGRPAHCVTSVAGRRVVSWMSIPGGGRTPRRLVVTSISVRVVALRSHSAAAERCDSAAPAPVARTAASQRPSRRRAVWPTAYTPG